MQSQVQGGDAARKPSRIHLQSIDGLRGFACLCVVLFHCCTLTGQVDYPRIEWGAFRISLWHPLVYGYSGVELFFALSGFCLAYPIYSRPGVKQDWLLYVKKRARRILPSYWIAFTLAIVVGKVALWDHIDWLTQAGYLQFALTPRNVIHGYTLINSGCVWSYWTLPLEWRWYFLFPIVALLIQAKKIPNPVYFLAAMGVAFLFAAVEIRSHQVGYYLTALPIYLPIFVLGVITADMTVRRFQTPEKVRPWENFVLDNSLPLALVSLVLLWVYPPAFDNPLRNDVVWGAIYFFLLLGVVHNRRLNAIFSHRILVLLGTISYSWYLTHEVFVRAAALMATHYDWPTPVRALTFYLLLPLITIGFAALFFLVAEKPFTVRKQGAGKSAKPEAGGVDAPAPTKALG